MSEPDLCVQCFGQAVVLMRELRHISREGLPKGQERHCRYSLA
jgi:hypothetical protein